ncbi:TonB-dependent siderophore receptor [Citrobacter freundii complex sp. CFNIH2]|uniref:TonB-dependent siderophore receptor n=1 Tax=Citrobacter freundii complex sp. CFNIH2 TaxID=2066049 RepID=UPI001651FD2B|nr:TonB-dependent siderophore receptor [Citrobacter freundii complex sp. CFNIH2]
MLSLLIASAIFIPSAATYAAVENSEQQATQTDYQIPAGNLSLALVQFSLQSGLQLIAPSPLTDGHATQGLSGRFSPTDALVRLLAGSGLSFSLDAQHNTVTLSNAAAADSSASVLDAVRVEGMQSTVSGGANGSTDITATEGSNSYTTTAVSIGGKTPQSLKETPQSVSVITSKQIKDQNLTDLDTVMTKVSGVTTKRAGDTEEYYSRGWRITNIQLDGGTPIQLYDNILNDDSSFSSFDMSMFDHAEILRGGDSLNSVGSSSPGGSINLTRKRPLDHGQIAVSGQAGSWNDYRTSLDVTGPLGFDGKLRGRAVATWQDKDRYYHPSEDGTRLLYGILEADLTPTTLLTFGGSYTKKKSLPWEGGLPRYQSGRDAELPRDTSLALPWSHREIISRQLFAQLRQELGEHWTLNSQLTWLSQNYTNRQGSLVGALPDLAEDDRYTQLTAEDVHGKQYLADISMVGKFDLFNLPQQLAFSGSYQKNRSNVNSFTQELDAPSLALPQPDWQPEGNVLARYTTANLVAKADAVLLPFLPDLHFQSALRWDSYDANFAPVLGSGLGIKMKTERTSVPYYALRYDLSSDWSVYSSYTDLYQYQAYMTSVSGATLPPMTGNTKEVGVKYSNGATNASFAAYHSVRRNKAEYDDLNVGCSLGCYRVGSTEEISEGFDFDITGEPLPRWSVNFGYTYNNSKTKPDPKAADQDRTLASFAPKHLFKLWNDVQLSGGEYLNKTRVGLGIIAQTRSFTSGQVCSKANADDTCDDNYIDYQFGQGFYSVISTRVGYRFSDNWSAAVNFNNLFDRRYYSTTGGVDSGNWYGAPRNVVLSIDGTF